MSAQDTPLIRLDRDGVKRRLADSRGRIFWQSLEQLSADPKFREFLHREFPEQAAEFDDPKGRRQFLTIMGASLALAGLTACTRQPDETIVPYVRKPEDFVPGKPLFFASAVTLGGYATGVLVESHQGRPTKIEGNPDHPASLGATDAMGQAEILGLYDPDRSQTLTYRGETRPWTDFQIAMRTAIAAQKPRGGAGLRILTETVTSPSLAAQIQALLTEMPGARWHQYEAAAVSGGQSFGRPYGVQHRLADADVIVCLEADFVSVGGGRLRAVRDYAKRRKQPKPDSLNRLYVAECSPSLTGAIAEHRLAVKSSEIEGVARALAGALGVAGGGTATGAAQAWVAAAARDLQAHPGRSVVLAGEYQPPAVHALAQSLNESLGNAGKTVFYTPAVEAQPVDPFASLRELVGEMNAGRVELLLVLGGNPAYDAPADMNFTSTMERVATRVHLGLYNDETAEHCHWHVPMAHVLESWGDARADDGTVTIQQPLIAPLYGGRSAHEVLATLSEKPSSSGHDIVKAYWNGKLPGGDPQKAWQKALHDGVVGGTAFTASAAPTGALPTAAPARPSTGGLEVVFRPDPTIHDGRYANLGWLQELPKPLTKITWDNAVLMSPKTAATLGVKDGNVVTLRHRGRSVNGPVWIMPMHADDAVTVHLGYGRRRTGRVGTGAGFDANLIRTSDAPWFDSGLEIVKVDGYWELASTQEHWSIAPEVDTEAEKRHVLRSVDVEEYAKEPAVVREMTEEPGRDMSLFPSFEYGPQAGEHKAPMGPSLHKWGMAIDLNSCVGCNACVTACQAENNIPVVGKEQVARGREMQWIRVDRYYAGNPQESSSVSAHFQPVPCMQCENAPCEQVCPVGATVHSDEGLNDQVYNRCIGTRYCSNNCPYKVRRFNFLLFQDWDSPSLKLMRNPEVSVRSRGVMEKCTYCVQRIQTARIEARNAGSDTIKDGAVKTACQQACPAEAIVFGDLADPRSAVSQLKQEGRNYSLLGELNTRPRTTYLAQVKNPNPALGGHEKHEKPEGGEHHG